MIRRRLNIVEQEALPDEPSSLHAFFPAYGNWRGFMTLTGREIHRFIKIWGQTLVSPLVMTLLFYAVFAVGVGNEITGRGVPFLTFLIPGLVMMAMAQSAFANTSISLILSKFQGNIADILMAPLSPLQFVLAYAIGGVVRGVAVGVLGLALLAVFSPLRVVHLDMALYFGVMGSLMLSLIGLITGLWGDKFDHLGAVQNFIVMPATFLSGTFFTVSQLPPQWQSVCYLNPFYYMIDGFRYGVGGVADSFIPGGMALLFAVNLALFNVAYWMVAKGTGLKT